jgi:hypothetical protein
MQVVTKRRARLRFHLACLSAVVVGGLCLLGDSSHGASPSSLKREFGPTVNVASPEPLSPNTFAISLYEVSDPSVGDPRALTLELKRDLDAKGLNSKVEVDLKEFSATFNECQAKKDPHDVVWVKETDYGKEWMVLTLSVYSFPTPHPHPEISEKKFAACTNHPTWDDCRQRTLQRIVEELAGLDILHKNMR